MLIKRNVYFSQVDEETGEERLFSTTELISEEAYQREFAEKSKEDKLKTAGKVAAGVGGASALAGGLAENIIADKVVSNVAKSRGLTKEGWGLASRLNGFGNGKGLRHAARPTTEQLIKVLPKNKAFKIASRADRIGTGVALAGAGLYAAGKIMKKKKDKK